MAGSTFGKLFRVTTWGVSHGKGIGVVVDGCPAGLPLCEDDIQIFLNRRKPGQSKFTTPRKESDTVEILSGVFEGKTTGTPISMVVWNENQKSKDYSEIASYYRPGHADFCFDEKYGFRDYRGGGRSSGRETIGRVAAGAIAIKLLNEMGITFLTYSESIGPVKIDASRFDVSEINNTVGKLLEDAIHEDELLNLGELTRGNSLELLSDSILSKLRAMKDKNVAAEVLSRAIKTTIGDIGKINLTLQEKFSTKFNKIVDMYNERTDIADIEKIIEEMIKLKKEIEEEIANGNEYDLSPEEKAFFDALGADPEIKELMQDEVLVQIAKDLVELINENLTLDAFKREDARARIRSNIRRLLIQYNYPPVKREGAVDKVIKQAELKYSNN